MHLVILLGLGASIWCINYSMFRDCLIVRSLIELLSATHHLVPPPPPPPAGTARDRARESFYYIIGTRELDRTVCLWCVLSFVGEEINKPSG